MRLLADQIAFQKTLIARFSKQRPFLRWIKISNAVKKILQIQFRTIFKLSLELLNGINISKKTQIFVFRFKILMFRVSFSTIDQDRRLYVYFTYKNNGSIRLYGTVPFTWMNTYLSKTHRLHHKSFNWNGFWCLDIYVWL